MIGWEGVLNLMRRVGPALKSLARDKRIGRPCLDIAMDFPDANFSKSARVPFEVGFAVTSFGVDVEISVYRSSEEETSVDPPSAPP